MFVPLVISEICRVFRAIVAAGFGLTAFHGAPGGPWLPQAVTGHIKTEQTSLSCRRSGTLAHLHS